MPVVENKSRFRISEISNLKKSEHKVKSVIEFKQFGGERTEAQKNAELRAGIFFNSNQFKAHRDVILKQKTFHVTSL